jgi:hypothetical protein
MRDFRENRRGKGCTFLAEVNEITLTRVRETYNMYKVNKAWANCGLRHGVHLPLWCRKAHPQQREGIFRSLTRSEVTTTSSCRYLVRFTPIRVRTRALS